MKSCHGRCSNGKHFVNSSTVVRTSWNVNLSMVNLYKACIIIILYIMNTFD